ncbi:MAG: sugar phosphate isomerase/epimerase family protein [Thermomicrobiales bacterium]
MTDHIALQLYTLRQQAERDFVAMLREVAAAGYTAVELAGYGPLTVAELRRTLDQLGLRAISSHVGYRRFADELDVVLEELRLLGCSYAVVPGIPRELRASPEAPARLAARFDAWGAACASAGLRFGYHNHGWEFEPRDGSNMLDLLTAKTKQDRVDVQIDIFWALTAGVDVVSLIQRHPDRVPTLHAKELAAAAAKIDTTIGDGITPWPSVLAAAAAAGTAWFIVEQEDDPDNAYRDIRRSRDSLRQLLGRHYRPAPAQGQDGPIQHPVSRVVALTPRRLGADTGERSHARARTQSTLGWPHEPGGEEASPAPFSLGRDGNPGDRLVLVRDDGLHPGSCRCRARDVGAGAQLQRHWLGAAQSPAFGTGDHRQGAKR